MSRYPIGRHRGNKAGSSPPPQDTISRCENAGLSVPQEVRSKTGADTETRRSLDEKQVLALVK
jgi:hypothetical protein